MRTPLFKQKTRGVAMVGIFLILVITPFLFNFQSILPYEPVKILFFEAIVGFLLIAIIIFKDASRFNLRHLRFTVLDYLILIFLFVQSLATIFSLDTGQSFFGSFERRQGLFFIFHLVLFYFFVRGFVSKENLKRFLIPGIVFGSFPIVLYAILQHYSIDFWHLKNAFRVFCHSGPIRSFSSLGHPNFLGAYLVIIMPFTLFFALTKRKNFYKISLFFVFIAQGLALLFTFNRGAWLAFIISMFFFFCFWFRKRRKLVVALVVAVVIIFFSILLLGPSITKRVEAQEISNIYLYRLASVLNWREGSILIRINEWLYTAPQLLGRPILGYGPESYIFLNIDRPKNVEEKLKDCGQADTSVLDRAHNQILDTFAASGILGLGVLIIIISIAVKNFYKKGSLLSFSALSALIAYLVANQFSFDFSISAIFFFFLIAISVDKPLLEKDEIKKKGDFKKYHLLIIIPFILILIKFSIFPLIAGFVAGKGLDMNSSGNYTKSTDLFGKASFLDPQQPMYKYLKDQSAEHHPILFY